MRTLTALVLASFVSLSACREQDDTHSPPGAPEPEVSSAVVSVWQSGYEAFVEYEYPVAKAPVRFITHISSIATGAPRREGALVILARGPQGQELRQRDEKVARDGIYLPFVTFPSPGEWSVTLELSHADGLARVALPPVTVYATREAALAAPAADELDGIAFLKEQQWTIGTRAAPVGLRTLVERQRVPALVKPRPGSRVIVGAPLSGRLLPGPQGRLALEGEHVEAGEILALVQPLLPSEEHIALGVKLAEAEAEELRATQALEFATRSHERIAKLAEASAKSKRELEEAIFILESAKFALDSAKSIRERYLRALDLTSLERVGDAGASAGLAQIRAPISGTVVHVHHAPGERVGPESDVFVILDASIVFVEASVAEHAVSTLPSAPAAYVERHASRDGGLDRRELRLVSFGLEVDKATRRVPLLYEIENTDTFLRVGMSLDVFVESSEPGERLAVPESALVDEDGRYTAYVQLGGETFERRELSLGVRDAGFVEVRSGLEPGERVVTHDPWALRLASLSTSIPEHHH